MCGKGEKGPGSRLVVWYFAKAYVITDGKP